MINKVLCVEDDPIAQMINQKIIEKAAFANKIETALNGELALRYYESISTNDYPDLIFLDLNMPIMDGWQFLEEFNKIYGSSLPDTRVIILSSSVDPLDKDRANSYSNVIDFLSKPLSVSVLESLKKKL